MDQTYKKQLDEKTTALETLDGEFQIQMLQIKLMQNDLQEQLIQNEEKKEAREQEMVMLKKEAKRSKNDATAAQNTEKYLRKKLEEKNEEIKTLQKYLDNEEQNGAD